MLADCVCPDWSVQPMLTLSPGWCGSSADWSADGDETGWPLTETITSPAARPAWLAGDPETTPATEAPLPAGTPLDAALLAVAMPTPRNPVGPRCTVAEAWPASIWRTMESAALIGIARPGSWPAWTAAGSRMRRRCRCQSPAR